MRKTSGIIAVLLTLALAPSAWALCPAPAPGNTAEDIRANQQRLICLQQEAAEAADARGTQIELDAINRRIQQMQLQRRIDSIPRYEPPEIRVPVFD